MTLDMNENSSIEFKLTLNDKLEKSVVGFLNSKTGAASRLEKRMIDKSALREAFINAVVHNDYSREVPPLVEIYADRLSITSYGGLVAGLSKEEFFRGRSIPRNRELMRIFKDMGLTEHIGSGMNRILKAYSPEIFHLSENFLEVVFPFDAEFEQVTQQVTEQVTEQVKRLVKCIDADELSIKEILSKIHLKHRPTLMYDYIKPAMDLELIEMSDPDSPNSPHQRYRLTAKGHEIKKQLAGLKYEQ